MLSMDVAATAMPYRPASEKAAMMATQTNSTGHAVERMDTPRPAMMLVP
jgi:hypothetical protein